MTKKSLISPWPTRTSSSFSNYKNLNFSNVFFYEKNYLETLENDDDPQGQMNESTLGKDKHLTIERIINKVNDIFDFQQGEEILSVILGWKFSASTNILQLLCDLGHERVAAKFMNDYIDYSGWDFFYHCVLEEKSYFLKHALRM